MGLDVDGDVDVDVEARFNLSSVWHWQYSCKSEEEYIAVLLDFVWRQGVSSLFEEGRRMRRRRGGRSAGGRET